MTIKVIKVSDIMAVWNKYAAFVPVKSILDLPIYDANIIETREKEWSENLGKLFIGAEED